jgi:hypothetical protein
MAVDRGCIDESPFDELIRNRTKRAGRTGPRQRSGVSEVPEEALVACRKAARLEELVCVDLMYLASATLAEASAVAEDNIDWQRREVRFSHVMDELVRIPQGDSAKDRAVPVPDRLAATLIRSLVVRRLSGRGAGPLLTVPMRSDALGLLQERAGLCEPAPPRQHHTPLYPAQDFGHTAAIHWCGDGVGLKELARRLGYRGHKRVRGMYRKWLDAYRNRGKVAKVDRFIEALLQRAQTRTMHSTDVPPRSGSENS